MRPLLFLLVLFLTPKCTFSTSFDAAQLIENLKNAIKTHNFSTILHPDFKIFSCSANLTKNLAQIQQDYQSFTEQNLKFYDFQIVETSEHGSDKNLKLDINSGQLIAILTIRDNSQILFETHQKCQKTDAPLTFGLVDGSFLRASLILDQYLRGLAKPDGLRSILSRSYNFQNSQNATLDAENFIEQVEKLGSPVVYEMKNIKILQTWSHGDTYGFTIRRDSQDTQFTADRDFKLLTERQLTPTTTHLTNLIDLDATMTRIATSLFAQYVGAIRATSRRMFGDIVAPGYRVSDCNGRRVLVTPDEYFYLFLAGDKNIGFDERSIGEIESHFFSRRIRFHVYVNRNISDDQIVLTAYNLNNKYVLTDENRLTCFDASQRSLLASHLTRRFQSLVDAHVAAINLRSQGDALLSTIHGYTISDNATSTRFYSDFSKYYPEIMPNLTVVAVDFDVSKDWLSRDVTIDVATVAAATNITLRLEFFGGDGFKITSERRDADWKTNYEKSVMGSTF